MFTTIPELKFLRADLWLPVPSLWEADRSDKKGCPLARSSSPCTNPSRVASVQETLRGVFRNGDYSR